MNLTHAINGYSIETDKRNTFIGYQRQLTSEGCAAMARQAIRFAQGSDSNWYWHTRAAYWYQQAEIARNAGR